MSGDPAAVVDRVRQAMNDHDLAAFLAMIHEDYRSEQPAHPERAFAGRAQVEENWSAVFRDVPGFHADVLRQVVDGDTVWTEWAWSGARRDGGPPLDMRGVTLFGVRDGKVVSGRLYMELVTTGDDIHDAVRRMAGSAD
jgi:ketosteroid isomerase-like protein